jgi:hypothetical protein
MTTKHFSQDMSRVNEAESENYFYLSIYLPIYLSIYGSIVLLLALAAFLVS